MLRLLKYLGKREWIYAALTFVFTFVSVWLALTIPDCMSNITTLVQTGGAIEEILKAGGIMLLCCVGDAACTIFVGYLSAVIGSSFGARLRGVIYRKITSFSMEEISQFSTSSLVIRSTNDVMQVLNVITMGLSALLRAPMIAIWSIVKIVGKGRQEWLLVTIIAVCVAAVIIISNMVLVVPKFRIIQRLTDNLNRVARENLTGVRVVRAYNAEKYQEDKFGEANNVITKTHLFTGKVMAYMSPGMQFVMSCTSLAIYWVGAFIISNTPAIADRIGLFSNMVVFMQYAIQVIMAFMMLSFIFIMIPRAQVSGERIREVLGKEPKIHDGPISEHEGEGTVEFRDVSFKYPDAEEAVLEHVSFKANKGDVVAFIGSTGSGKSTLINLVPRFYDVTDGAVLVDGIDVREYSQKALHEKIGYVSQKAQLFKGTLASNIEYGENEVTDHDEANIIRALTIAQGADIIEKEEKGIYAEVAQGGSNFSGGQKQRISIARAVFSNPEIYVFDDSFSALDYKTDKILRATLKKETQGATTLIVAQRIGTVKDADTIVVLDEGKVVGQGTHDELMRDCEVYRQIAYSQLSKEELGDAR